MGSACVGFCLSLVLLLSAGAVRGTPSVFPPPRRNPIHFASCSLARDSGLLIISHPPNAAAELFNVTNVNGPFLVGLSKATRFMLKQSCSADFTFTTAAGSKFPHSTKVCIRLRGKGYTPSCSPTLPCPIAIFYGMIRKGPFPEKLPGNNQRPGTPARSIYTMRFSRIVVSNYFETKTEELNVCDFLKYSENKCPTSQPPDGP